MRGCVIVVIVTDSAAPHCLVIVVIVSGNFPDGRKPGGNAAGLVVPPVTF